MTKKDKAFLYACVIGDGHIRRDNTGCLKLCIKHCERQTEYLRYKVDILSRILGKQATIHTVDNNGYPGVYWTVGATTLLRPVYAKLYPNGKKDVANSGVLYDLTPEALAVLWMDDGCLSLKKREGVVHGREGFLSYYSSHDNVELVCSILNAKFGLSFSPVKDRNWYRMRTGSAGLNRLIPVIAPYIVPCMQYKIDMHYCTGSASRPTTRGQ